MVKCVNPGCNSPARLDLIVTETGGGYHGGSWCSIRCLAATPYRTIADAYPGQAERPVTADA